MQPTKAATANLDTRWKRVADTLKHIDTLTTGPIHVELLALGQPPALHMAAQQTSVHITVPQQLRHFVPTSSDVFPRRSCDIPAAWLRRSCDVAPT